MRFSKQTCLLVAFVFGLPGLASAQFFSMAKPQIVVPINHPPNRGLTLAGKKVAFAPVQGRACADQFQNKLMSDLQAKGAQLIERGNLDSLLAEHNFQLSGSVDPATAVQIGKLLGPSAMLFVSVTRCEPEQQHLLSQDFLNHPIYISQTRVFFSGSVRVVDLTTGQDLGISNLTANPSVPEQSQQGYPEFPPVPEIQDRAFVMAAAQAENDYFPWTEQVGVDFLNDKDCNLRQAFDTLKAGDVPGALQQSQANVVACKSDTNTSHQAHALYNLGITQMLSGKFDDAIASLQQAEQLHDDRRDVEAIAQARKAKTEAGAVASSRVAQAAADAAAAQAADAQQQKIASQTMTNDTVIKLVKGGLSDAVVIKMVGQQPGNYQLTPDALLSLKQAGVSDAVIAAMLDKKN